MKKLTFMSRFGLLTTALLLVSGFLVSNNLALAVMINNPTTGAATAITSGDAVLNGTNGSSDATGHSFWVSTSTFSTESPTIPAGVYSTVDLGAISAATPFSATLSSDFTGFPGVTSNTTYYFVAWAKVGGTWYPGEILSFTTDLPGTLAAEDFGVVNYDTGLGILKGYTAGFGLTDATFGGATSVVVQLFAGDTLLQTNTAIIPKFNADITGTQFSSPFDVLGTFDYVTDGYWTNVRENEYGQTVAPTKVIATASLSNGKVMTAQNINLTGGNPEDVMPITFEVNYIAGSNGSITGYTTQNVVEGGNSTSVTAVANSGYHFVNWSDGLTTASRSETNVISALSFTANFVADSSGNSSGSRARPAVPATPAVPGVSPAIPATPAVPGGQVLGAEKFIFTKFMKLGSTGNEVLELQKLLTAQMYYAGPLDGIFGPLTEEAVKTYQAAHPPLKVDGIVGPKTRGVLNA